jgi:predicted ester cyclase
MARTRNQSGRADREDRHEKVVEALIEAMCERDVEALVDLWEPGGVEEVSMPPGVIHAPDGIREFFGELFAACPDHRVELVEAVGQGDRVAIMMRASGTFSGEAIDGLLPTGKEYRDVLEFAILELADGRIRRSRSLFDRMDFGRQIGFLPPEGAASETGMKRLLNLATRFRRALRWRRRAWIFPP